MLYLNFDNFIPFFTLGVSYIAALFFTYYYYLIKDTVLRIYKNYLWFVFLYIFFRKCVLLLNFNSPIFFTLFADICFWISLILHVKFLFIASEFKNKKKFPGNNEKVIYGLTIIDFLLFISTKYLFPDKASYFQFYTLSFSIYFFVIVIFFNINFYKKTIATQYRFLYSGSLIFHAFNTSMAIMEPQDKFLTLSRFSIMCLGLIIEITIFALSLGIKLKNDYQERIFFLKQNSENTKRILLQEIEKQNVIGQSKHYERMKISVDIHDGISNAVAGLKFYINNRRLISSSVQEKDLLKDIEDETNNVYSQIREYVKRLHSDDGTYEKYNISDYLSSLQEKYNGFSLQFILNIDVSGLDRLLFFQQRELYYILSESIGNAIKHSGGDKIIVTIQFCKDLVHLSVSDNGKGFLYDENMDTGLGLTSIKERIKSLDGSIEYSFKDKGTTILGKFSHFQ